MGSGCNPNLINKPLKYISSDAVLYQGEANSALGICTGDSITEVEQAIIDKISSSTYDGADITLETLVLSACSDISSLVGTQDPTVLNVIQALVTYACTLRDKITNISTTIAGDLGTGSIDFSCLTAPTTFSFTSALQVIINAHCALKTTVDSLVSASGSTTVITSSIFSSLKGLISTPGGNGLVKTTSSTDQTVTYSITGLTPPYSAIPYFGPLTNFDSSGKGLTSTVCQGWYLCNGNNGTPDLRGVNLVGAVSGVPGGTLASNVDPSSDSSMNYALKGSGGATKVKLVANNLPAHNHPVTDPTHTHPSIKLYHGPINWGNKNSSHVLTYDSGHSTGTQEAPAQTQGAASTGVTVGNNTTTNTSIDVRSPYVACYFIMRFD